MNEPCGYGYTDDFTAPTEFPDWDCLWTYNSPDCNEECLVIEAVYMSVKAVLGMLYYYGARDVIEQQFPAVAPDEGMTPLYDTDIGTLEGRVPDMYNMVWQSDHEQD